MKIVPIIISVDKAFTSGETPFRTIPKIFNGNVVLFGPAVKKLTTTSSNDMVSASIPPDITPGAIIGNVTLIKVWNSFAPKSLAASSIDLSKPDKRARTVITTKGMEKVICEMIKVIIFIFTLMLVKNINNAIAIVLDNKVIYAPVLKSVIEGGKCSITGDFTKPQVQYLAALCNNGELPVSFKVVK